MYIHLSSFVYICLVDVPNWSADNDDVVIIGKVSLKEDFRVAALLPL